MGVFLATQLSIPVLQIVLLLGLSTLTIFLGRLKLALLINYCFTLYWGYLSLLEQFGDKGTLALDKFFFVYLGCGLLIATVAMIAFLHHQD